MRNENNINYNNFIEIYSNDFRFNFIKKSKNKYTKAIDIWNYYKNNNNNILKQKEFYNKLSKTYGYPIKKHNTRYFKNVELIYT